jgi:signal recognition particle receptor subunit beta
MLNMFPLFQRPSSRVTIILLGPEGSGKTTLLYRLKYGSSPVFTSPSLFSQAEMAYWKGQPYHLFDVGGDGLSFRTQPQLKALMNPKSVVFFLVDSTAPDFKEAAKVLGEHLPQMLKNGVRFLWIIANKQDLDPGKASTTSGEAFRETFHGLLRPFRGQIMMCIADSGKFSGLTGTGVSDLLDQIPIFLHNHADFKPLTLKSIHILNRCSDSKFSASGTQGTSMQCVRDQRTRLDVHMSQLQMAYLILLGCIGRSEGIFDAAELLTSGDWFRIESNREPHRYVTI